ncbi:uncharacterized protein LOC130814347 isoform X2 [Amaranthus tricolor]|uniref:uncharacterized protein LOC130814347 isoform X2 n=1 Tax=Amaranthus tricolor TaxID=29722 RepID=UPI00258C82F8|nr:uncharacterized protein LOC130814347 isoform X2 [Amaranthus tricolor]
MFCYNLAPSKQVNDFLGEIHNLRAYLFCKQEAYEVKAFLIGQWVLRLISPGRKDYEAAPAIISPFPKSVPGCRRSLAE